VTTGPVTADVGQLAAPRTVVMVGTDHHPFDRLMDWTRDWLSQHPDQASRWFVQSGAAAVVPDCPGSPYLAVDQLGELLDDADVIICHGGPASVADAWRRGRLPIVVPRQPELGEHVDDHQVIFCRKVAELGRVALAQTPADFAGLLHEAANDRSRFRARFPETDTEAAVARLGELVEELVSRPRRRLPLIRRGRQARRSPAASTGALAVAGTAHEEQE
jgi:UDP-N-acetylglucosamine transferase subunit ALG13